MLKSILTYLWGRRTTVLGYVVTVLGVLATSNKFTPSTVEWFVLIIGIITAVLGHHNNAQARRASPNEDGPRAGQGGFARPLLLVLLLAATVPAVLVLPGCTVNPVAEAQTFEQKAYALYGTYVIAQGTAAKIVRDPAVPEEVKNTLRNANRTTYQVAESLVEAANEVADIRDVLERCDVAVEPDPTCVPTNQQRLTNAVLNLSSIYYNAKPVLLGLIATVKGAR